MEKKVKFATFLAVLLDTRFTVLGFRFGLSALLDLIPGFGDAIDAVLSLFIVWVAIQLHVPKSRVMQMVGNIAFSFLIGLIPFIGDLGYIFYKPNIRNVSILKKYLKNA